MKRSASRVTMQYIRTLQRILECPKLNDTPLKTSSRDSYHTNIILIGRVKYNVNPVVCLGQSCIIRNLDNDRTFLYYFLLVPFACCVSFVRSYIQPFHRYIQIGFEQMVINSSSTTSVAVPTNQPG